MQYTVREYGHLGTHGESEGLDYVRVSPASYAQLKEIALTAQETDKPLLRLSKRNNNETLQALNYVGVLGINRGEQLEILPKTSSVSQSHLDARRLLWKMLHRVTDVSPQELNESDVSTLSNNWLEALTRLVLKKYTNLVRSGIKRDYVRREERSSFLKGQLQVAKQMRARPGTEHKFFVEYDQYITDRPENRLLKSCLLRLNRWSASIDNKRLCRELLFVFEEVPESTNYPSDLRKWRADRGMSHYQPLLPWIKLILSYEAPVFSAGGHHGVSLLFPMEKLYEEYVFKCIASCLPRGQRLVLQAASEYLVTHRSNGMFQLRPDGLLTDGSLRVAVLDTKWKLVDSALGAGREKYGLSQADFYQMFAYGMKYMNGQGELVLIYPSHERFSVALEAFEFDKGLKLWVLPFDLNTGRLILSEGYSGALENLSER
ncbi:McrC family protein [Pseudohalioglobus lutimaris]|uniref:Restriction endonuclease n=1 Tax=Pseudohalioglobus lutimaris TaxID=1737061 RepID=A0A2N5WXF0_9GAMM|nr:McrC family protein [Pseudohalioglobus lutimaris]PLW66913.1 restriction endonuclease [Pseudohalioglobus lutimaris]